MPDGQLDHDLLIAMNVKLDNITDNFASHLIASEKVHLAQELRLSAIEKWRWQWGAVITVLIIAANIFSRWVIHN